MTYVFHRMSKIHRIYKNWVAIEWGILMGSRPHSTLVTSLKGSSPNTILSEVRASIYAFWENTVKPIKDLWTSHDFFFPLDLEMLVGLYQNYFCFNTKHCFSSSGGGINSWCHFKFISLGTKVYILKKLLVFFSKWWQPFIFSKFLRSIFLL